MRRFVEKFINFTWRSNSYYVLFKKLEVSRPPSAYGDLRFHVLPKRNIAWLVKQRKDLGAKAERIVRQQFFGDDLTVVGTYAEDPGKLVFTAWISRNDFAFNLLSENFNDSPRVSVRRIWVSPENRKSGIATMGMAYLEQVAAETGGGTIWSFVQPDNAASLRLHDKRGYMRCGIIHIVKLLGRRIAVVRCGAATRSRICFIPAEISKL